MYKNLPIHGFSWHGIDLSNVNTVTKERQKVHRLTGSTSVLKFERALPHKKKCSDPVPGHIRIILVNRFEATRMYMKSVMKGGLKSRLSKTNRSDSDPI